MDTIEVLFTPTSTPVAPQKSPMDWTLGSCRRYTTALWSNHFRVPQRTPLFGSTTASFDKEQGKNESVSIFHFRCPIRMPIALTNQVQKRIILAKVLFWPWEFSTGAQESVLPVLWQFAPVPHSESTLGILKHWLRMSSGLKKAPCTVTIVHSGHSARHWEGAMHRWGFRGWHFLVLLQIWHPLGGCLQWPHFMFYPLCKAVKKELSVPRGHPRTLTSFSTSFLQFKVM